MEKEITVSQKQIVECNGGIVYPPHEQVAERGSCVHVDHRYIRCNVHL